MIEDKEITLESKPINKIFAFDSPPYLIFGSSNSGKSVLALDIIYTYSEICSNIYYITATTESIQNTSISSIPKCFRRVPTCENLINIWEEIKNFSSTINVADEQLLTLLTRAFGKDASNIIIELNKYKQDLHKRQNQFYINRGQNQINAAKLATDDANAFLYETIAKIIDNYIKENGDSVFSAQEMALIRSFYSQRPLTLLILDDITGQLEIISKSNQKVLYEGKLVKEKDALASVLIDILTRGRHYNCMVCIFLHTAPAFLNDKSLLVNIVLMNASSADKLSGAKTIPETSKQIIKVVKDYVFQDYPYYFIHINSNNVDEPVCVGKASLHVNEPLKLDTLNKRYVEIYTQILSGVKSNNIPETIPNSNENEYEYEYEEDDDVL